MIIFNVPEPLKSKTLIVCASLQMEWFETSIPTLSVYVFIDINGLEPSVGKYVHYFSVLFWMILRERKRERVCECMSVFVFACLLRY